MSMISDFDEDGAYEAYDEMNERMDHDDLCNAYDDGMLARRRGMPLASSAYTSQPRLRAEWENGWNDEDHIIRTGF